MPRLCVALATTGLLLGSGWGVAAQVRDRPLTASTVPLGTIAGRVEIEIDRQRVPVRRARVTVTADAGSKQSTTITDTDGRYRVERLAAGTYRVRAEKPGFVVVSSDPERPSAQSAPVQIKAGDAATVAVEMQRGGALEGQFLDENGHGIKNLKVYADRLVGPTEPRAGVDRRSATTDDLGRFRLHTLWPGRYYLHATPPPPASGGELYFPDAPSSRQATVLALAAGQTIDHLDFRVANAPLSAIAAAALATPEPETSSAASTDVRGASVAGRVTRSDTGEPLANATVRMSPEPGGTSRTARSNARGEFEFTGVSKGSYALTATADGFVSLDGIVYRPEGAGRPIDVKASERIEKADLTLALPGAIEGRVLDEFGDPAPGVSLQVTQLINAQPGLSVFLPSSGESSTGPTDDRGWFRVYGLPPGDYYLLALSASLGGMADGPARSPAADVVDNATVGFATTFFPGTESVDAAAPVHVGVGPGTRDVTFGLVAARMVTISGVATGLAGQPVSSARVMLLQTYGGDVRTMSGSTTTATVNGSFRFPAVPEGTYVLQASQAPLDPKSPGLFGSLPVTAAATFPPAPLPVTLTLRPLTTARGRVSFEGDAAPPRDPTSVRIYFQATDFTSGPAGGNGGIARINPAGDFEIPNLAWQGLIRTIPAPGWLLKSVSLNGRDITDTPYDFQSADVNGLEIVLTSRVGAVAGTVLDAGKPGTNSMVVVFGADDSASAYPSRFVKVARPSAAGEFTVPGLLPGRYLAVATPALPFPKLDRAGLATLRPFATPIEVSDGLVSPLTLTMIRR